MKNIFTTSLTLILLIFLSLSAFAQVQEGVASYYSDKFEGKKTASGEKYNGSKMTAAHMFLPFGTRVKVTNLENNKSVELRINDRGPFIENRILDVSWAAANELGFITQGLTNVRIEIIETAESGPNEQAGRVIQNSAGPESDFYKLSSSYTFPSGFGVQLASFSEPANLVGMTANLKRKYGKKVLIQTKRIKGNTIYAVILGSFNNRKKAEKLLTKAKEQFPGAYIIDFSKVK